MAHVIADAANENLRLLRERLATISDVYSVASVLGWDRQTYMPSSGVGGRTKPGVPSQAPRRPPSCASPSASTGERATRPPGLRDLARATALAEAAWIHARNESDWSMFAPHMERVLPLWQ